jgi:hypothetical protein
MTAPEAAFAGRLLTATEELFAGIEAPGAPALLVFQHARELVSKEPCDPRLVLAATLVIELESNSTGASAGEPQSKHSRPTSHPSAEQLLSRSGMDDMDIRDVHGVVQRCRGEQAPSDIETKIVCDAAALAQLTLDYARGELDEVKPRLDELKTQAGKERARSLFDG